MLNRLLSFFGLMTIEEHELDVDTLQFHIRGRDLRIEQLEYKLKSKTKKKKK